MIEKESVVHVEVLPEDIHYGVPMSGIQCPIALALRRKYPGVYVQVNADFVSLSVSENPDLPPEEYILPEKAQVFIRTFDSLTGCSDLLSEKDKIDPIEFDMQAAIF